MAPAVETVPQPRSVKCSLDAASVVFWDFDGVIKDSLDVKSDAFEQLFRPYGAELAARVRAHHNANGGLSRFEKVPLYLRWAGEEPSQERVNDYCSRFSQLVRGAVIESAWVPGAREYLLAGGTSRHFILVTATPQQEIESILVATGIDKCFREVHGAPVGKSAAIRDVLARHGVAPADTLFVGDALADLMAAQSNGVPFGLRRTPFNTGLQRPHVGLIFDDFTS